LNNEFQAELDEALDLYRKATLSSEASASSYDFDPIPLRGTSHEGPSIKAGREGGDSAHLMFYRDELPQQVRMVHELRRLNDVWRAEQKGADGKRPAKGDRVSRKAKIRNAKALECRGWTPNAVAYVFDLTTESVRKLRQRNGLDPDTGVKLTELERERVDGEPTYRRPLTALPVA